MARVSEVLLVDDSDADNFLHRRLLLRSGLVDRVSVALNGAEGLAYLKQAASPPDVVFLDINMPVLDGWGFLERFEEQGLDKKLPVVIAMLTTSMNPKDRARGAQASSVSAFVTKPLTLEGIHELIDSHFPGSS